MNVITNYKKTSYISIRGAVRHNWFRGPVALIIFGTEPTPRGDVAGPLWRVFSSSVAARTSSAVFPCVA